MVNTWSKKKGNKHVINTWPKRRGHKHVVQKRFPYRFEPFKQFVNLRVSVCQRRDIGCLVLSVLDVDLAAGQAEAANDLDVAVLGGQVDRVHAWK